MPFQEIDVVRTTEEIRDAFDVSGVKLPWRVPAGTVGTVVIAQQHPTEHYEVEVVPPDNNSWFFVARGDQLKADE